MEVFANIRSWNNVRKTRNDIPNSEVLAAVPEDLLASVAADPAFAAIP